MIPKRIDVNIICSKCQKPISGAARQMDHDPINGKWVYGVSCHGEHDEGPHLTVDAHEDSHGATLWAFPNEAMEAQPRGPNPHFRSQS